MANTCQETQALHVSAQVVEPCTPYDRDVGQTGRQAGGLSCCRSGGQHAASRHCQEGGGRQTLLAGEDKTPFPPVFLQSDPYQIKSEEGEQTFVGEGKICHSLIIIGEVLSL